MEDHAVMTERDPEEVAREILALTRHPLRIAISLRQQDHLSPQGTHDAFLLLQQAPEGATVDDLLFLLRPLLQEAASSEEEAAPSSEASPSTTTFKSYSTSPAASSLQSPSEEAAFLRGLEKASPPQEEVHQEGEGQEVPSAPAQEEMQAPSFVEPMPTEAGLLRAGYHLRRVLLLLGFMGSFMIALFTLSLPLSILFCLTVWLGGMGRYHRRRNRVMEREVLSYVASLSTYRRNESVYRGTQLQEQALFPLSYPAGGRKERSFVPCLLFTIPSSASALLQLSDKTSGPLSRLLNLLSAGFFSTAGRAYHPQKRLSILTGRTQVLPRAVEEEVEELLKAVEDEGVELTAELLVAALSWRNLLSVSDPYLPAVRERLLAAGGDRRRLASLVVSLLREADPLLFGLTAQGSPVAPGLSPATYEGYQLLVKEELAPARGVTINNIFLPLSFLEKEYRGERRRAGAPWWEHLLGLSAEEGQQAPPASRRSRRVQGHAPRATYLTTAHEDGTQPLPFDEVAAVVASDDAAYWRERFTQVERELHSTERELHTAQEELYALKRGLFLTRVRREMLRNAYLRLTLRLAACGQWVVRHPKWLLTPLMLLIGFFLLYGVFSMPSDNHATRIDYLGDMQ